MSENEFEGVVIGGGAAGLNGALMLARARRSVLVIDAGAPRNAPASGVHGLLARDGMSPAELLERGRAEVRRYGGQIVSGEVIAAGPGFTVDLADGGRFRARRLLVTTGLVDELPDIPGLRDRWGRDVVHCPYCHGWEVRDTAVGVLGTGPMSVHQALLFRQWSGDVTYFSHVVPPSAEEAEQLAARGVPVIEEKVTAVEVRDDRLTGVRLADGRVIARETLVVAPRMVARAGFLSGLGLRLVDHPAGERIAADPTGATDVPGVWAAGNVTDLPAQVGAAAAAGALAAARINADLIDEEIRAEVAALRAG
ncbi:MAG TPA: NAD(P)/FAD-dependent oxidoreductase [Mycobacteriales bacterium]|nr:NAD(P)/FAD-dependent oxidoreductase [Mycobacteriales bacterium]